MNLLSLFLSIVFITNSFFPKNAIIKLLEGKKSVMVTQIDSIPTTIFRKMNEIVGEDFEFADIGEDFNKSDAIENENWPFRRLIFSVNSVNGREWLIYYEKGGRSHTAFLSYAVTDQNDDIKCIYNLTPKSKNIYLSKRDLLELLRNDSFKIIYNNGKILKRNYTEF